MPVKVVRVISYIKSENKSIEVFYPYIPTKDDKIEDRRDFYFPVEEDLDKLLEVAKNIYNQLNS